MGGEGRERKGYTGGRGVVLLLKMKGQSNIAVVRATGGMSAYEESRQTLWRGMFATDRVYTLFPSLFFNFFFTCHLKKKFSFRLSFILILNNFFESFPFFFRDGMLSYLANVLVSRTFSKG